MIYSPQINDYVIWNNSKDIQGWVYFKCKDYITIEKSIRPKDSENYNACSLHANERVLVLCYSSQWNELKYIKSRETVYET